MSNKKKPSPAKILFMVLGTSVLWIFLVLIPAGIQIYQFFGGDIYMLNQFPSWVWFAPLFIYIMYVLARTAHEYRKELEIYQNTLSVEQSNIPQSYGVSSSNQSGGFTGNNTGQVFQGDVHYHERENPPAEFYIPKPKELKNKINIETLNLQRELKTFSYLSGENKRKQFEVVLEVAVYVWKNFLNPAKTIFRDTQVPVLIDEIYTQITRFRMNWEILSGEYDEKNNWLRVAKSTHPDVVVINKRISDLEIELSQLLNSIEAKISMLIDLTKD